MEEGITLKERMDRADAHAKELVGRMKDPGLDREGFGRLVKQFVCCKFLLDEAEASTDSIMELAEASVEKMLALHDRSVDLATASFTCSGPSSVATKKVLLIIVLQKALGVEAMAADRSAAIERVPELADELFGRMKER